MKKIKYFLLVLPLVMLLAGCDEHGDPQGEVEINDKQKAAIIMRGTWGSAFDVSLPFGTTKTALDNLTLTFRIDDDYNPTSFSSNGAPYFFSGENGAWSWADDAFTLISLQNISPITNINVSQDGSVIRLTFNYTPAGPGRISGAGGYGVSLRKIAP